MYWCFPHRPERATSAPLRPSSSPCGKPAQPAKFATSTRLPSAQIVVICGKNESLKTRMERAAAKTPANHRVATKVIGFTTEMDELMTASDILLGKPGGLTTAEALAKGLVFVIANPIPGQEERNSDHLLEEGVAIRCNNLPAMSFKIDRLLDDPARFASMQASARRLARPRAAFDIAEKLLALRGGD